MAQSTRNTLAKVMNLAWQFIKNNGMSKSEAMKKAWANIKLKAQLVKGIVKFYFQKKDGSIREAYGTLKSEICPETKGNRRDNPTLQTYFDTEKHEWRCFKIANLLRIA